MTFKALIPITILLLLTSSIALASSDLEAPGSTPPSDTTQPATESTPPSGVTQQTQTPPSAPPIDTYDITRSYQPYLNPEMVVGNNIELVGKIARLSCDKTGKKCTGIMVSRGKFVRFTTDMSNPGFVGHILSRTLTFIKARGPILTLPGMIYDGKEYPLGLVSINEIQDPPDTLSRDITYADIPKDTSEYSFIGQVEGIYGSNGPKDLCIILAKEKNDDEVRYAHIAVRYPTTDQVEYQRFAYKLCNSLIKKGEPFSLRVTVKHQEEGNPILEVLYPQPMLRIE